MSDTATDALKAADALRRIYTDWHNRFSTEELQWIGKLKDRLVFLAAEDSTPGVPMVCTTCRNPVERVPGRGGWKWEHVSEDAWSECPLGYNEPVKAMVAGDRDDSTKEN